MLIIPDTNFLIYLSKYKLWHELTRLYGHYTFLILPQVAHELKQLAEKAKGKDKEASLLALTLIKKVKAKKGSADLAIIKAALQLKAKQKFVVATMDKELVKKLKKQGIVILTIRQKKYLEAT